jgi:hypothetical protein
MHARLKTMQRQTSTKTKRTQLPGGSKTARKIFKNLKAGDQREGRKLRKGEVKFETNIRRRGRGGQVRWVPCVKVGKKNREGSEGLLEASHAGKGTRTGKTKCGWVKGRLG